MKSKWKCPLHGRLGRVLKMTKRIKSFSGVPLLTNNRFAALSDSSDPENEDEENGGTSTQSKTPAMKKPKRLPNIVVDGHLTNHKSTMMALKATIVGEVDVRSQNNRTVFRAKSTEDFHKIKEFLQKNKYTYITHTPSDEKPLHMVLKGLPPDTDPQDIQDELSELQFKVLKVTSFKKKDDTIGTSTMSVIFDKGSDIKKVMSTHRLYYSVVSWEKYVSNSSVTQCYKCLKFGHIAVNCTRAPKCLNCAGDHSVKDCANSEVKCANCNGEHQANFKECEFQKKSLQRSNKPTSSRSQPTPKTSKNPPRPSQAAQPSSSQTVGTSSYSGVLNNGAPNSGVRRTSSNAETETPSQSHRKTQPPFGNDFSCINEIKSLFRELNISKIISAFKTISVKLKSCNDTFEKVTTVLEVIFDLF